MNKILNLIGLAYRGRNLESGETPVTVAIKEKKARIVLVAFDSSGNTKNNLINRTADTDIPLFELPYSKAEIGSALGKSSCSMVAFTDSGFSLVILDELLSIDGMSPINDYDPKDGYSDLRKKLEGIKFRKSKRQKERRRRR